MTKEQMTKGPGKGESNSPKRAKEKKNRKETKKKERQKVKRGSSRPLVQSTVYALPRSS